MGLYLPQVNPLCVPEEDTAPSEDDTCVVIGWGNTAERELLIK